MLQKIISTKQHAITQLPTLDPTVLAASERNFLTALQQTPFAIIAEMKQKSPSEGLLDKNYDPATRAQAYAAGGATALSVLTDTPFFGGDYSHINAARAACHLPVLCKDFIIDTQQIYAALAAGADACLLIVRILTDTQLQQLKHTIEALNMTALIEVFSEEDLHRALAVNAQLIGINNRDLDTLVMDTTLSALLQQNIDPDITCLSLSGIQTPDMVQTLKDQQFDGVLMGTCLMRAEDPAKFLRQCIGR